MANPLDDLLPETMTAPAAATVPWTPAQEAVFDFVANGSGHGAIEAVAGSGKTTTIVGAMAHARGDCIFLAFNKAIATELAARVPMGHEARTFNSIGHKACASHLRGARFEMRKLQQLNKEKLPARINDDYGYLISQLVHLAKGCALGVGASPTPEDFLELMEVYDLTPVEVGDVQIVAAQAKRIFVESIQDHTRFDFSDQLYLPVLNSWKLPTAAFVFVDEAQDLNPIQHYMLRIMMMDRGRIVAVGDPRQAIYGFRGAQDNSMYHLTQAFKMKEFPLHRTYRCPQAVVAEARSIVPYLECPDDAPIGVVDNLLALPPIKTFVAGDMILCRNNAPLMRMANRFLREKHPFRMQGDYAKQLLSFIRNFKTQTIPEFLVALKKWYEKEHGEAVAKQRLSRAENIKDKYESLIALTQDLKITAQLTQRLEWMFTEGSGVVLSSIHRAKGLESDRVFLLRPDLIPSRYARTDEQLIQETNLKYVAITRAKREFYYIEDPEL